MADYTQTTFFAPKDLLTTGNPDKIIYGAELDPELSAISTAIATKYDSSDLATSGQAATGTDATTLMTPSLTTSWGDANAGIVGDLRAIASPGADRLLFWDQSAGAAGVLTASTGLSITGTTLTTDDASIVHDSLSGFVANEHIDHSTVSVTGGVGLTGGGTIDSSSVIDMNISGLTAFGASIDSVNDQLVMYDASAGLHYKVSIDAVNSAGTGFVSESRTLTAGSGLTGGGDLSADRTFNIGGSGSISVAADSISVIPGGVDHDSLLNYFADDHVSHSGVSINAGTGLTGGGNITVSRTLSLSHLGLEALTDPNDDRIIFWDDNTGATGWLDIGTGLTLSTTTLSVNNAALSITESQISDFGTYIAEGGSATNLTVTNLHVGSTNTTLTEKAGGTLAVENDAVFSHASSTYTSAKITFNTTAPTGGSDGDIWFEYT